MPDHPASQGEGLARKPGHIDVDILRVQCVVPIKDVQMQVSGAQFLMMICWAGDAMSQANTWSNLLPNPRDVKAWASDAQPEQSLPALIFLIAVIWYGHGR
jgi:hypothetical protein